MRRTWPWRAGCVQCRGGSGRTGRCGEQGRGSRWAWSTWTNGTTGPSRTTGPSGTTGPNRPGSTRSNCAICLDVLRELEDAAARAPRRRRRPARHRAALQDGQAAPPPGAARRDARRRPGRDRGHRHRRARAASTTRPRACRSPRPPTGATAGTLQQPARLLRLQAPLPRGRRLLPPALPGLRRAQPRPPRRPHRPDRPARAAHRRPGQDRHVHRAAAAARRRAHHDHHALPATTRCAASPRCPTAREWLHRLRIVGIDLRDPAQVVALADSVAAQGPLDILINNAAQTVRRSPGAYAQLVAAEAAPLPDGPLPEMITFASRRHRRHRGAADRPRRPAQPGADPARAHRARADRGSASPERIAAGTAIDAGGLVPDLDAGQQLDPAGRTRSTRSSCSRCSSAT